jgi:hypothetical protein
MLAGVVLSAVLAGCASLAVSILSGHPPIVSLLFYSLAGCAGLFRRATSRIDALFHFSGQSIQRPACSDLLFGKSWSHGSAHRPSNHQYTHQLCISFRTTDGCVSRKSLTSMAAVWRKFSQNVA